MAKTHEKRTLPALVNDDAGATGWAEHAWPTEARGGMVLTPRIGCSSLRLRRSAPCYEAGWHVAGDPVLIVVQRGVLRIGLRDGSSRDFGPGEAFIAADRVPDGQTFDDHRHGHRASVVGGETLEAIHIKLAAE